MMGIDDCNYSILNEEFLVSTSHQLVLITSLPFVHTARRLNRLDDPVNDSDLEEIGNTFFWEVL